MFSTLAVQGQSNAAMQFRTRYPHDIAIRLSWISTRERFENSIRFVNNRMIGHNFDFAIAGSIRVNGHKNNRLDPAYAVFISGPFDLSLDGVIEHQLKIQVLQTGCLVREEGKQVAPISLRTTIDSGMMWNSKVPSEMSYTSKPLRWDHLLEELEGNTVLPELERVGAV